jgi:molybdopterin-containing oxidoreductase family iron-sulfur binding subunit
VLLSHSFASPTFKKLFAEFKAKYPTAELVTYDAYPYAAALDAAQEVFGQEHYRFMTLKELNWWFFPSRFLRRL